MFHHCTVVQNSRLCGGVRFGSSTNAETDVGQGSGDPCESHPSRAHTHEGAHEPQKSFASDPSQPQTISPSLFITMLSSVSRQVATKVAGRRMMSSAITGVRAREIIDSRGTS